MSGWKKFCFSVPPLSARVGLMMIAVWFCACALQEKMPPSAAAFYQKALREKQKKNYSAAAETLQKMRERFPYSSVSVKARLLLADMRFEEEKYPAAAKAYTAFRRIYPRTKPAYVLRQLGLCHLRQLPSTPDRDISSADPALRYFRELAGSSEESPYKKEAQEHIAFLLDLKAKKEFAAASFYIKRGLKEAGLSRFQHILTVYPESSVIPKVRQALKKNEPSRGKSRGMKPEEIKKQEPSPEKSGAAGREQAPQSKDTA